MSLEDEKWPLWSKKEGKRRWIMRHGTNSSSCMEVWNLKSGGNMYFEFEAKIWSAFWSSFWAYYIFFWRSGIQESNASNGAQIRVEMKKLWPFEDNCAKLKDHFEMISKFNLWIRNDPNFEFTHCNFDVSPPPCQELHLGHSICSKWAPWVYKSTILLFSSHF